MYYIKNWGEAVEELKGIIKRNMAAFLPYQMDIYGYINDCILTFDEFVNVGGNSWLNDDHIKIYQVGGDGDCLDNWYGDIDTDDIIAVIGKAKGELITEIRAKYDFSEEDMSDEDIEEDWLRDYIFKQYEQEITEDFIEWVEVDASQILKDAGIEQE